MHTSLIQKCPLNAFTQKNISFSYKNVKKSAKNLFYRHCFCKKAKITIHKVNFRKLGDLSRCRI